MMSPYGPFCTTWVLWAIWVSLGYCIVLGPPLEIWPFRAILVHVDPTGQFGPIWTILATLGYSGLLVPFWGCPCRLFWPLWVILGHDRRNAAFDHVTNKTGPGGPSDILSYDTEEEDRYVGGR